MKLICTIYCLSVFIRHGAVSQTVFTDSELHKILESDKKQSPDLVVESQAQDTTKNSSNEEQTVFSKLEKLTLINHNRDYVKKEDRKNIWNILIDVNIKEVTNTSAETLETDTIGIIIIVLVSVAIFAILIGIWLCFLYRFDCRNYFLKRRSTQGQSDLTWIVNSQNQENL